MKSFKKVILTITITALSLSTGLSSADDHAKVLEIGDTIPIFAANDDAGNLWTPDQVAGEGEYLVVYFYPAAMTGGCTAQACAYRDNSDQLQADNIIVVGVSGDSVNNLRVFKEANELNFALLSDVNGVIAEKFGVPKRDGGEITRELGGKEFLLKRTYTSARWTYVFDPSGTLVYKDDSVKAAEDSERVLAFIEKHKATE